MGRFFTAIMFVLVAFTACVDDKELDGFVDYSVLPERAKEFVTAYFIDQEVIVVKEYNDYFELGFSDNTRVRFTKDGFWTQVHCFGSPVPKTIIEKELPTGIPTYLSTTYKGRMITGISKSTANNIITYGVELTTPKLLLKFDKEGKPI